ncbi:MAG: apolipoprotein N-acyltransferase [Candidatus Brocadiaceae bacterium]|nr:apolipoprotein N-acyltransferase [Candidatus Brocadiaceae bacterium]
MGFLAWIALIPWFILIATNERYFSLHSLGIGILFFFIQLSWMRYVTIAAWILLPLYCSTYFLCFAFCTKRIFFRLKLPLIFIAPCTWAALEFIRSFFLSGFPWFFIGHTQYQYLTIIQITDITGVYGVSFIIVLVNAAIADLIVWRLAKRNKTVSCSSSQNTCIKDIYGNFPFSCKKFTLFHLFYLVPLFLVTFVSAYGFLRIKNNLFQEGPTICMVQGNIPQEVKADSTEEDQITILKKYTDLSMDAKGTPVDLLVWPETMMPGLLNINPELTGRKIDFLSQLTTIQLAQHLNAHLLLGGISLLLAGEEQIFFNSAYYYNRQGTLVDRYDKIHLVPFGEFTPLEKYFPFLSKLVPYNIGLSPGRKRTLFHMDIPSKGYFTFGASICYEDTVPSLVRKFKKEGANFMINITNDGWFHNSSELDQHLAIMVFRAVENRMGMARAANTGISSFVSPDGTIYDRFLDQNGNDKEVSGILINTIKLKDGYLSFYTNYGDWFSVLCVTATAIMLFLSIFHRNFSLTFCKR